MPKNHLKSGVVMTLVLCSIIAITLYAPSLKRGVFFREDYLPYLKMVARLFAVVSLIAIFRGDKLWHGDIDVLLILIVALYFLTNLWAQSRMKAMDGALKYAGYLMVFVMARYASATPLGNRIVRNLLILMGVVVASGGYLTAAGYIQYPDAVKDGALLGSFQYPNALAAFAMFILFFLYHAWGEGSGRRWLDVGAGILYAACAFLLVGAVFLANSRVTLLMFSAFMAMYLTLLPAGDRARIAVRVAVSLASFASVATRLDTAISKGDAGAIRQGLAVGLTLAAVLECLRRLWEARLAGLAPTAADVSATSSKTQLKAPQLKIIFLRAFLVTLALVLAGTGLIATAKNPSGAKALARVLPQRIVNQLRTLKFTDRSLLTRLMASKDALSIALGFPFGTGAGGWEALYHEYQRTPYWFTETHNHFAQMLVEVGFPGLLLYIAFWGLLAFAAVKGYMGLMSGSGEAAGRDRLTHLTSTAMAVFALGAHSAADFDLSLPAIAVSLFIAIGALASSANVTLPRTLHLRALAPLFRGRHELKKKARKKGASEAAIPWELVTTVLLAAALTATVACKAGDLYKGMVFGSEGVRAAIARDHTLAGQCLAEARKRDKWNPTYAMDLALLAVNDYQATGDTGARSLIPLYMKAARTADPRNLSRQILEARLYEQVGMLDEAVRAAYDGVLMMPTNREYHEILAEVGRAAMGEQINALLRNDLSDTERQDHMRKLSGCVDLVESSLDILQAKRERVTGLYASQFNPKGLDPTPKIFLVTGQIAFLTGNSEECLALLQSAAKTKDLTGEANRWLACLATAIGDSTLSPKGSAENAVEIKRMAELFGAIEHSE